MGRLRRGKFFKREYGYWWISMLFFCFLFFPSLSAAGAAGKESTTNWLPVILGFAGGLAFFIYGTELLSDGMKRAGGDRMREAIAKMTQNRVRGFMVGAFTSTLVQSSSALTLMLVGLVQAGILGFPQTLGVILGAGVGSSVTAQLIAFKVTDYALIMVALGFFLRFVSKADLKKNIGQVILGFGILFYGMKLMGSAMDPLSTDPAVLLFLQKFTSPAFGFLTGLLVTAFIQSTGAIIGILIVLGGEELLDIAAIVPIVLGANIGTSAIPMLASLSGTRESQRVSGSYMVFKIAGVILFLPFLDIFTSLVAGTSSMLPRQIANAHTFFNIGTGLLLLPFTKYFARFLTLIIPDKKEDALPVFSSPLEGTRIVSPDLAIEMARHELARMAGVLEVMIQNIGLLFLARRPLQDQEFPTLTVLQGIHFREENLNFLDKTMGDFLFRVARHSVTEDHTQRIYAMISISKDLESIGDLIKRNALPLLEKKQTLRRHFSEEGRQELREYHSKVLKQIRFLKDVFAEKDLEKATKVMTKKHKYLDLEMQYRVRHMNRILSQRPESIETHEVHTELFNLMAQIIVYTSNIAKTFVSTIGGDTSGEKRNPEI